MSGRKLGTNLTQYALERRKERRKGYSKRKIRRKGTGREGKGNIKAQLLYENGGRYSSFQHISVIALKKDFKNV